MGAGWRCVGAAQKMRQILCANPDSMLSRSFRALRALPRVPLAPLASLGGMPPAQSRALSAAPGSKGKVVLLYSGGLDTSTILLWVRMPASVHTHTLRLYILLHNQKSFKLATNVFLMPRSQCQRITWRSRSSAVGKPWQAVVKGKYLGS